jgi:GNAT superfamily N-acetyltransferase
MPDPTAQTGPSPFHIAHATAADADRLAPLLDAYRVFYGKPSDPGAARAFLEARLSRGDSAILMVLAGGDEPAGFTQLYPTFTTVGLAPAWILNDLFVAEGHRGRGVGAALIRAAEGHARREPGPGGAAVMMLLTAHDNLPAQRLYARMGWVRDEQFQRWTKRFPG